MPQLLDNEDFEETIDEVEVVAWHAFKDVCNELLEKKNTKG